MIDRKAIKEGNLSHEDVIDVIQEVTGRDRISAEFIYAIEMDEIEGDIINDTPDYLKPIVANAPDDDQAIGQYLTNLVRSGKITTDDVTFLIDSGALKN